MEFRMRRASLMGLFLAGLALPVLGATSSLQAQQPEIPKVSEEKLAVFAKTFAQVSATRDEFYARLGRTHDDVGKLELRASMDARIAEVIQENGLTFEEYQRLNVVVSTDAEQRAIFDRLLQEILKATSES